MQKTIRWFKKLKKWQKGGLIGLAVGVVFAALPYVPVGWVFESHMALAVPWLFLLYSETNPMAAIFLFGAMSLTIVVFYSTLGIIAGKIQQSANPFWRWTLTALLAILLLAFYILHFI